MTELTSRLLFEVTHHKSLWRANFAAAAILFLAAIASSALATIFAATNTHGTLLPWLTAIPGVILLINNYFKFGDRYVWHFNKSSKLNEIFRQVEYGNAPTKEAVDWWNLVDREMTQRVPEFGEFSIYPYTKKPK
jgi:hypothetical protein